MKEKFATLNDALEGNRMKVMDYWDERPIVLAFSRQDKGLIAIGRQCAEGGEEFIHVNVDALKKIIENAEKEWTGDEKMKRLFVWDA